MIPKEIAPHLLAAINFATETDNSPSLRTLQIQEDSILKAVWKDGIWEVTLFDVFSGKTAIVQWTQQQFAAVQFIIYNGDEQSGPDIVTKSPDAEITTSWSEILAAMYEIAEPLFKDLPVEVRPIP